MNLIRIFVYGTLKPGEINYQRLCVEKVVEQQEAYTFGELYDLSLGYPAMTTGKSKVRGFLLTFAQPEILSSLDCLEGYNPQASWQENEYYRQQVEVYNLSGNLLGKAWAYFMTLERVREFQGILLSSGCWSS